MPQQTVCKKDIVYGEKQRNEDKIKATIVKMKISFCVKQNSQVNGVRTRDGKERDFLPVQCYPRKSKKKKMGALRAL